MKLICGPTKFSVPDSNGALRVILYGQPSSSRQASAGETAKHEILRRGLNAQARAWDLLSIALSVVTADYAGLRSQSPDGWTREFELEIAVTEPAFWNGQATELAAMLAFLTTDLWAFRFYPGAARVPTPSKIVRPDEHSVLLMSGGLDSLVGGIDLAASGRRPFAVSQTVRGDGDKQVKFAQQIGITHLQVNHNARAVGDEEPSQRARSFIFVAFASLVATALRRYHDGHRVPLYVCENGFIALNAPLTGGRLGSLSTRTAHPEFLGRLQGILDAADLRVSIEAPYLAKTKGEMLRDCLNQSLLKSLATRSTSCGRFQRFSYRHCGRCVPCQVRRAAFLAWGESDSTGYVYEDLGRDNSDHARFDDVRSVAMALADVSTNGLDHWVGASLASGMIQNRAAVRSMIQRGLDELQALHQRYHVK